jgi:hypothetical protein
MYTYGLSDNKVATSIVDIVIIFDKIARRDVPYISQSIACLVCGGGIERACGGPLFQAQSTTWEVIACWHKKSLVCFLFLKCVRKNVQSVPGFIDCIVD